MSPLRLLSAVVCLSIVARMNKHITHTHTHQFKTNEHPHLIRMRGDGCNKICPTLLVDTSSLRAVHISSRALCVSLLALPTADKHSAVDYSHTRNVCCMQYTYVWVKDIVPSFISIHSYPPHSYLCLSVCVYMRFVCDADQLIPNAFPSRRGEKHTYNRIKRARATRHPR